MLSDTQESMDSYFRVNAVLDWNYAANRSTWLLRSELGKWG